MLTSISSTPKLKRHEHLNASGTYADSAKIGLGEIQRYLRSQGASFATARGFTRRIRVRCGKISNVPHIGTARDDILPGLRMVPFERSAVILYVVETHRIRITNIFFGGRDYEALMREAR
jgi:toxin ParE1/3/4